VGLLLDLVRGQRLGMVLVDSLPDLLSAAPDFTRGFGTVDVNFGHFSQAGGPGLDGSDIARVYFQQSSSTTQPLAVGS